MGNKSNKTHFGVWHFGKKFFFVYLNYTISDGNIVWIANYYAVQLLIYAMCFWLSWGGKGFFVNAFRPRIS